MSQQLTPVILAPGTTLTVSNNSILSAVAMKVSNTSPYDLDMSGYGVVGDEVVPSGIEVMLYGEVYNSGSFNFIFQNNRNITPANAGVVLIVAYYSQEEIPRGHWPVTIPTSVVQTTNNTLATLVNTGNIPGTLVITIQPSDVAGNNPTVSVDNSGNVTIMGDISGVLTNLLKLIASAAGGATSVLLGDSTRKVEVQGFFQVDGLSFMQRMQLFGNPSLETTGAINMVFNVPTGQRYTFNINGSSVATLDASSLTLTTGDIIQSSGANDLILNVPTGQKIRFRVNGVDQFTLDSANLSILSNNNIAMTVGHWGRKGDAINTSCGSGTVISHGLGLTPNSIPATPNIAQPGSATVGIGSVGSSTFTATVGAGSALTWLATSPTG